MLARCRGGRTFGRARLAMATATGTCLRCGSPVSPYFDCYLIVIFLGPSATRAAGGGPAHDPRLQEEANVLETRRKSIGPSAHLRRREEKVSWLGDGRRCFSLLFTMWVVADRTCNHSPKLSAKDDRRRGVPVHAYLNSSFRFVDFTSAP